MPCTVLSTRLRTMNQTYIICDEEPDKKVIDCDAFFDTVRTQ